MNYDYVYLTTAVYFKKKKKKGVFATSKNITLCHVVVKLVYSVIQ